MERRKRLSKAVRIQIYEKYYGRCAYCGKKISYENMQVDCLEPLHNGEDDNIDKYIAVCRICRRYKKGKSLEEWREMLEKIPEKLRRDNAIYNIGLRYRLVKETIKPIKFYFERFEDDENDAK